MSPSNVLRHRRSGRLLAATCLAVCLAVVLYGIYKRAGGPASPGTSDDADSPVEQLREANRQLKVQVERLQAELRATAEERDGLKEDKAQLLYMVEKLQQQSVKAFASKAESGFNGKMVRSWLLRISELRDKRVAETAPSRDAYVKEVNEIVRGLKEDFAQDAFITGMGYAVPSSRPKDDIRAAQRKLDDIIRYLRAYDY